MHKTFKHKSLLFLILSLAAHLTSFSQSDKSGTSSNIKIDNLLKEKRKINQSLATNDSYKIQIFYGTSDDCKTKLREFKNEFDTIDGTIVYANPNFKVWVGNFETRLEVEKTILDIRKKYPTALIIKPSK